MSDLPFGFVPPDRPEGSGSQGQPPGPFGVPDDLAGKVPLFAELNKLLSWQGGPVNWDLARQLAISYIASDNRQVRADERDRVVEAVRLADLWLDPVTSLPSGTTDTQAWTRVDWIERTLPVWSSLCDPVAKRVVEAMGTVLPEGDERRPEPIMGVIGQLGGMMFGAQFGQAIASLATEVLTSTDIGLPLGPAGTAALVPENVEAFGTGLGRPADEVRLFLALREAAHHRLFGHVPWLRQRLLDTVDEYARGITVDMDAIERAVGEMDPSDLMGMREAVSGGLFEPKATPEQRAVLTRLETLLALVEGWVDDVVATVATDRLPGGDALRETLRRRRASGGPAEQTFASLVGLELRPRRSRDAAALWHALGEHRGTGGRDEVWAHPDLMPGTEDLDDPEGFARGDGGGPSMEDFEDGPDRG